METLRMRCQILLLLSLRAPASASEERTPSTCVSCRSTRARLYRCSSFCEQNCFSDLTNNCNNLFFFKLLAHSMLLSMSLHRVSPVERDMEDLRDSRHRPYRTVGVFFVPRFFLCLHQQRQRPVFLQLALTIDRYVLLKHREASGIAIARRADEVERRFLIEFSSIFMTT